MDILKMKYKGKEDQLLKNGCVYESEIRINDDQIDVSISGRYVGFYSQISKFLKDWEVMI